MPPHDLPAAAKVYPNIGQVELVIPILAVEPSAQPEAPQSRYDVRCIDGVRPSFRWEEAMDPVQGQLEAFNARDLERFLSYYAPHTRIEDGAGNLVVEGHDGMRGFYGPAFANSPTLHAEVVSRIRVGNYIVDEERITGIVAEGFPPELHSAVVYHVDDDLITHVRLLS
jgi:hypothetical protein